MAATKNMDQRDTARTEIAAVAVLMTANRCRFGAVDDQWNRGSAKVKAAIFYDAVSYGLTSKQIHHGHGLPRGSITRSFIPSCVVCRHGCTMSIVALGNIRCHYRVMVHNAAGE